MYFISFIFFFLYFFVSSADVIALAFLFPIKSPVTTLLGAAFAAASTDFVLVSVNFFYHFFLQMRTSYILWRNFFIIWFSWISYFYNNYPIISVIFTLSSISSCLLFWWVYYTSSNETSVFVVFNINNELTKLSIWYKGKKYFKWLLIIVILNKL